MIKTKIDWADYVWNPCTGCQHGCKYCYARKMAYRLKGRFGYPVDDPFRPVFHKDRLSEPVSLNKTCQKIFVCSMGDLFGKWIPRTWIEQVLDVVEVCPDNIFIFLTKNPERYSEFVFPENAWLGYSTTGTLFFKWPKNTLGNIRFVSIEPMAEPLNIRLKYYEQVMDFHWLIVGAETGNRKNKYTIKQEWIDDVINFSKENNISLFIKDNAGGGIQEYPEYCK